MLSGVSILPKAAANATSWLLSRFSSRLEFYAGSPRPYMSGAADSFTISTPAAACISTISCGGYWDLFWLDIYGFWRLARARRVQTLGLDDLPACFSALQPLLPLTNLHSGYISPMC